MIVYIAGPMTGYKDYNRPAFFKAQEELEAEGHTVLNPAALPAALPDSAYLPICLAMIQAADSVYMLRGWRDSKGAAVEHAFASRQGKLAAYEEDEF